MSKKDLFVYSMLGALAASAITTAAGVGISYYLAKKAVGTGA